MGVVSSQPERISKDDNRSELQDTPPESDAPERESLHLLQNEQVSKLSNSTTLVESDYYRIKKSERSQTMEVDAAAPVQSPAAGQHKKDEPRSGRKLKTYRRSRRSMLQDEQDEESAPVATNGDEAEQGRGISPELGTSPVLKRTTPSQAKMQETMPAVAGAEADDDDVQPEAVAAESSLRKKSNKRKRKGRASKEPETTEAAHDDHHPDDQAMQDGGMAVDPDEPAEQQEQVGQGHQQTDATLPQVETAQTAEDDQLPTPQSQNVVQTWLEEHPANSQDYDAGNDEDLIRSQLQQETSQALRENAHEEDGQEYEVPSDSDEVYKPETQSGKKNKRKRVSTENGEGSARTKRVKKMRKSGEVAQPPLDDQQQAMNLTDFPRSGPFTTKEIKIAETVFEDTRKEHDLTEYDLNEKVQTNVRQEIVQGALNLLCQELPRRNRKAVQRFCRRHFNNFQRGKWTDDQDDLLRDAYNERPNKWIFIGERVGRMPEDCRDRWRNHVSHGTARNTDVWTEDEEMKLVRAISECLQMLRERGQVDINHENEDEFIAWPVVVQKMQGTRNRLQCTQKYRKIKARMEKEEQAQQKQDGAAPDPPQSPDDDYKESAGRAAARKRWQNMKPGDIQHVLSELEYGSLMGRFANEDTFYSIITRLHKNSPWTTQDRKYVYQKLTKRIEDRNDITTNVALMTAWMSEHFTPEELLQRNDESFFRKRSNRESSGRKSIRKPTSAEKVVEDNTSDDGGDESRMVLDSQAIDHRLLDPASAAAAANPANNTEEDDLDGENKENEAGAASNDQGVAATYQDEIDDDEEGDTSTYPAYDGPYDGPRTPAGARYPPNMHFARRQASPQVSESNYGGE